METNNCCLKAFCNKNRKKKLEKFAQTRMPLHWTSFQFREFNYMRKMLSMIPLQLSSRTRTHWIHVYQLCVSVYRIESVCKFILFLCFVIFSTFFFFLFLLSIHILVSINFNFVLCNAVGEVCLIWFIYPGGVNDNRLQNREINREREKERER